jgi:hypothetical protein
MALIATRRSRAEIHRRTTTTVGSPARVVRLARAGVLILAGLLALGRHSAAAMPLQQAQLGPGGAPGIVKSVAFAPLTSDDAITVRTLDDTTLNVDLKARFEVALLNSGRAVAPGAPLRLDFVSQVIRGEFKAAGGTLGSFEGNTRDGARVQLNLWSSSRDSLLGGQRSKATRRANVFHISADLRDTRSGRVIWRGDAFCALPGPEVDEVAPSLVAPLVGSLGQTVTGEPFEIE